MSGPPQSPTTFSINSEKIAGYLLNPAHPDGGSKARFLELFGFSASAPDVLARALLAHAKPEHLAKEGPTPLGDLKLIHEEPLHAPDGRSPFIRTVWRVLPDDTALFVTAVPLRACLTGRRVFVRQRQGKRKAITPIPTLILRRREAASKGVPDPARDPWSPLRGLRCAPAPQDEGRDGITAVKQALKDNR